MSDRVVVFLLLLPLAVYIFVFMLYPLAYVVWLSFYKVSVLNPFLKVPVGLANYRWLFEFVIPGRERPYFVSAFLKSLCWVSTSVALKVVLGLAGATLLNSELLVGREIYRTLVILPWAIPWAISAMMWGWFLNPEFGYVNGALRRLNIISSPIPFLSDPTLAFFTTVVVDVWVGLPFMVVTFLAGLQSIPKDLYEAATVDGAGPWTKFVKITLPMMKPVVITASLLSFVWTFNSFDIIWVLTRGGPIGATETLPIALYNIGFRYIRFGGLGKASAMTIAQVLVVSIISIFYLRALGREVSEE